MRKFYAKISSQWNISLTNFKLIALVTAASIVSPTLNAMTTPISFISNVSNTSSVIAFSGQVTDEDGSPIPGVNIVVKGTTAGTTTDTDGKYVISVAESDVLVFSFIG